MARQTLTMAITLEGADKVEADLSKLGPAAEKAFKKIKDAADKGGAGFDKGITGAVRRFQQQLLLLQAAGQRISRAFGTFRLAADAFGAAILRTATRIGVLGGAIGGAMTLIGAFASRTADNAERIDNQSRALGISAQAFQVFETAAKNAGLEGTVFDKIMAKFVTTAAEAGDASGDAAKGAGDLSKKLREVIVTGEDGSQRLIKVRGTSDALAASIKKVGGVTKGSAEDLVEFSKKVTALKNPLERIRAIMAAGFSKREAIEASTFFRAIANDADELTRAASRTVGPLSDVEIAIGVRLADAFDRFRTNIFRTKERLVTLFAPDITQTVEHFADLIFNNQKALEDWAIFIKNKAVPIVKDFINALIFNDDAVENKSIIAFRDAVIEFGKAVKFIIFSVIVPAFRFLLRLLDGVAASINAVFGTNLSGASILAVLFVAKIVRAFSLLHAAINLIILTFNVLGTTVRALSFGGLIGKIAGVTAGVTALAIATVDARDKLEELSGVRLPTMAITPVIANPPTAPILLLLTYWDDLRASVRDYFGLIDDSDESMFAGLISGASNAFEAIKNKAEEVKNFLLGMFSEGTLGRAFLDAETASFNAAWEAIKTGAGEAWEAFKSKAFEAIEAIKGFLTSLITRIGDAISKLRDLASARSESVRGTGGGAGYAGGGPVRGPGTSTSDNIPAWLSPGEFVIRAAAVRKWGSSFFAALNGLRMPKGGVKMKLGGLAASMSHGLAPRFAMGGPVQTRNTSTGRPLTLVVDNQRIDGMTASDDAVQQIMKFATGKQLRSNGRKPGWS